MRLLISSGFPYTQQELSAFEQLGFEVVLYEDISLPLLYPENYDAVICSHLFLHHPIENFLNLKWIHLTSAGYERIPLSYTNSKEIKVFNAGNTYSDAMAEYAVCGILHLYKQMPQYRENQHKHIWKKQYNMQSLYRKTVGIVGTGNVGNAIAQRLKPFGCKIIGFNRTPKISSVFDTILQLDELTDVAPKCDILILCIALTPETKALIRSAIPMTMRPGSILINVARGILLNEKEVVKALQEKRLNGVVLDVFEEEPLNINSPLWDCERAVLTPHASYIDETHIARLHSLMVDNFTRALSDFPI